MYQVISLRNKVRNIVTVKEAQLEAKDGTNAEDERNVDEAKLESRLWFLLSFILRRLRFL